MVQASPVWRWSWRPGTDRCSRRYSNYRRLDLDSAGLGLRIVFDTVMNTGQIITRWIDAMKDEKSLEGGNMKPMSPKEVLYNYQPSSRYCPTTTSARSTGIDCMYDEPINIVDPFRMQAMVHRLACALSNAIPCFRSIGFHETEKKRGSAVRSATSQWIPLRWSHTMGCRMMTTKNYDGLDVVSLQQRVERMVIIGSPTIDFLGCLVVGRTSLISR